MLNNSVEKFFEYKTLPYIFGVIIFLSNLTVVISSGLILKQGKQPKSTYLLLGNISLADTMIGASIIFGGIVGHRSPSELVCMLQMGILVAPTMVSKFSVGLIAVDRYIFIIHGLYYKRWCNTTRTRICIFITWIVGMILGFLPAAGWTNTELASYHHCDYISLFPVQIILFNSLLSIVIILLVIILYTIILIRALKNVKEINTSVKTFNADAKEQMELRIHRSNTNGQVRAQLVNQPKNDVKLKRSVSLNNGACGTIIIDKLRQIYKLSNSNEDLTNINKRAQLNYKNDNAKLNENSENSKYKSKFNIKSISSTISEQNYFRYTISSKIKKSKEPNKWRAVIVVMLTSGSFIFTWMPFFITAIIFVFCSEENTSKRLHVLLAGPVAALAFLNSILNPLIYAWWHKRFKETVKAYWRRIFKRFCVKNVNR